MKPTREQVMEKRDRLTSKRTQTTKEQRVAWSNRCNELLKAMREAEKAGNAQDADRYGDDARNVFAMGPKKYSELKARRTANEN